MLKAVLIVAGLALAVPGADSLHRYITNRTPAVLSCADYARMRPPESWLLLRECELDYLGAGYRESGTRVQELFFPVRPIGAPRTEPAALVAATRDPSVLAIAESGIGQGRQPNQEQFLVMMLKIVTALGAARDVEGMVRVGMIDRLRSRRILSGLTTPLAPGAVVVDLHARPAFAVPAIQTAIGLALLVTPFVLARRSRQPRSSEADAAIPEPVIESVPQPVAAAAEPVQLRGLLLLNLGPDASPQDIEQAPPLGTRDEAIRQITEAIPGMQFDARGRGVLRGAGHAVIVDIGPGDSVSSAIAGADGAAGADAIRHLIAFTGWRAYVPRTGEFWDGFPGSQVLGSQVTR